MATDNPTGQRSFSSAYFCSRSLYTGRILNRNSRGSRSLPDTSSATRRGLERGYEVLTVGRAEDLVGREPARRQDLLRLEGDVVVRRTRAEQIERTFSH